MTNYSYFSGANVTIRLNNNAVLECAGISFNLSNSAQPAYGYASQEFDMVLPGRKLLQGSFVVNYTEANYLSERISSLTADTVEDITDRNELFDISIQYGRNNRKRNLLLKNCYLISRGQTIQISEQVILEEFSFIGQAVRNDTPSKRAEQSKPVLKAKLKIQPNPVNKKQQTKQNTKVEAEILIVLDNNSALDGVETQVQNNDLVDIVREKLKDTISELSSNRRFNVSFGILSGITGSDDEIAFVEGSQVEKTSINYLDNWGIDFQNSFAGNIRISMLKLISLLEEKDNNKEYVLFYIAGDSAIYNEDRLAEQVDLSYNWKKDGKILIKVSENGECPLSLHQNLGASSNFDDSFKKTSGWLVTCVGVGSQFEKNNIKESILTYLNERFAD